jgi:hypothetical protein
VIELGLSDIPEQSGLCGDETLEIQRLSVYSTRECAESTNLFLNVNTHKVRKMNS